MGKFLLNDGKPLAKSLKEISIEEKDVVYPDIGPVLPKGEAVVRVCLSAEYLRDALEMPNEHGVVILEVFEKAEYRGTMQNQAVKVSDKTGRFTAYVMPMIEENFRP